MRDKALDEHVNRTGHSVQLRNEDAFCEDCYWNYFVLWVTRAG